MLSVAQSSYRGYHWGMKVGTKELKNRLSHYLRRVREGEIVYVADRGRTVAELRRVEPSRDREEECLRALAEHGDLTLGRGKFKDFQPVRARRGAPASKLIIQDRD